MDVRKNDTVKVIAGREKGKSGKVLEVLHERNRVRVEKLMTMKRHLKKGRTPSQMEGGIVEKAGTLHASNVMVICPKCDKPTRVARVVREKDGRRVRACRQCKALWE
jgi:large subunit ribosomal protein L24